MRRGQGFSLQTIVVAVLVLLVLVILIYILINHTRIFGENVNPACPNAATNCKDSCGPNMIQIQGRCDNGKICCALPSELTG